MSKRFLALAAALAVVLPAMPLAPASAQTVPIETAQSAPTLPFVSLNKYEQEIEKAGKPVYVLVVGENCDTCASIDAVLAVQATKHPELKFVRMNAVDAGFRPDELPLTFAYVPSFGWMSRQKRFSLPADVDGYFTRRAKNIKKVAEASAQVEEIEAQIAEKSKPFTDQIKTVQDQADQAFQQYTDRLDAIRADEEKALAPLKTQLQEAVARNSTHDEVNGILAQIKETQDSFQATFRKTRDEGNALNMPLLKKQGELKKQRAEATAELREQRRKAREVLDRVLLEPEPE